MLCKLVAVRLGISMMVKVLRTTEKLWMDSSSLLMSYSPKVSGDTIFSGAIFSGAIFSGHYLLWTLSS